MTPADLAKMRNCSERKLQDERTARSGPAYIKDGKSVLYIRSSVSQFMDSLPVIEPIR